MPDTKSWKEGLSPEQLKHADSIDWLFNGPLGVGKTNLLARVLVKKAIKNPGCSIRVFDHSGGDITVLREICKVCANSNLDIKINFCNSTIRCDG